MKSPLAESQRMGLIEAILPDVPFDGWTRAALRKAARRLGMAPEEALALFPGGAADLVAGFSHWADQRMLDRLEAQPVEVALEAARTPTASPRRWRRASKSSSRGVKRCAAR